jgi:hypothetical protein
MKGLCHTIMQAFPENRSMNCATKQQLVQLVQETPTRDCKTLDFLAKGSMFANAVGVSNFQKDSLICKKNAKENKNSIENLH